MIVVNLYQTFSLYVMFDHDLNFKVMGPRGSGYLCYIVVVVDPRGVDINFKYMYL